MNKLRFQRALCAVACAVVLTACGGGTDDEAGGPVAFNVSPSTLDVTADAGSACPGIAVAAGSPDAAVVGRFVINGGVAPYNVFTPYPDRVALTTELVAHRGQSFGVYLLGGCVSPATLTIKDSLNNQISVTITYSEGS
ncbi:MAG: hypothetical protein RLZZ618_1001 [Pseudomonadota bacterium]|jgi:hypothetical protein